MKSGNILTLRGMSSALKADAADCDRLIGDSYEQPSEQPYGQQP